MRKSSSPPLQLGKDAIPALVPKLIHGGIEKRTIVRAAKSLGRGAIHGESFDVHDHGPYPSLSPNWPIHSIRSFRSCRPLSAKTRCSLRRLLTQLSHIAGGDV